MQLASLDGRHRVSVRADELSEGFNNLGIEAPQHEKVPADEIGHVERERFAMEVESHKRIAVKPSRRAWTIQYAMRAMLDR